MTDFSFCCCFFILCLQVLPVGGIKEKTIAVSESFCHRLLSFRFCDNYCIVFCYFLGRLDERMSTALFYPKEIEKILLIFRSLWSKGLKFTSFQIIMTFIRSRLSRDVRSAALKQCSQKWKDVPIKRQRNYSIKSGTRNKQVAKLLRQENRWILLLLVALTMSSLMIRPFCFEIRKTPPAELKDFTGKLTRFKLPHTEDRKM